MIVFESVSKSYKGLNVLNNISLTVNQGEIVSLIGPSGCGKSTLLKCINGLVPVNKGKIIVDGIDVTAKNADLTTIRSEVGIVFQQFNLFPHLTVMENITLAPLKVRKISENEAKINALKLLEKVGLLDKIDKYPDQLSGGQAQRVAIVRSFAMQPKIMLFDEPTSALDPQMTIEVFDTVKELAKEGMTMIIVTHEMNFAREISNRTIFMSKGQIIEEGNLNELLNNPKSNITREFLQNTFKLKG